MPIIAPQSVLDKMPDDLKSRTTVLANGESKSVSDILDGGCGPRLQYHPDRLTKHPKGRDNGYVLTFGATRVYVAGDTEDTPEMRALTGIDVAFLPMNLPYTMDVEHAADAVKAFGPTIVFPVSLRPERRAEIQGAGRRCERCAAAEVVLIRRT